MKVIIPAHTTPRSGVLGMGRGISGYIYNLALALREEGHDVKMYVRDDYEPEEEWIETVRDPVKKWVTYPHFLQRAIRDEEADVFHSDFVSTGISIRGAGKRPCVVSAHDAIPFEEKPKLRHLPLDRLFKRRYGKMIEYAEAVIFMSEDARQKALELTDIDEDKAFAVHNGVDIERFRPLGKDTGEKVKIGYLGGLDARKNVVMLVEAFREMVKKRDDIELHVGGSGDNLERFREMDIPDAHFHGFIPEEDKADFYNSLDIFVFPSLREGFGMMLTEAMACGLPVVGIDSGPTPEIVADAGLIADRDRRDLEEKITELVEDEDRREELSERARERAEGMSWEDCAKDTMEVYREVMG